jgi:integrase
MFSYAVQREMIEYNPFAGVGVAVPQAAAKERDRVLSETEIKHIWETLSNWGNSEYIRRAILFILVTGQRPGEVAQLHWNEIEGRVWTIPSERSKNGRENRVYLTDLALSLLPETEDYVFPASRGSHGPLYVNTLSHHLSHHVKPEYLGLPRWTPHDLRRTAATGLASLGCSDEIIDEVQNHKKRGIIRTYNRYRYDKEKQEWLVKWSEYLERLIKSNITGC